MDEIDILQLSKRKEDLIGWKPDNNSLIAVFKGSNEKIVTCSCGCKCLDVQPKPPSNYRGGEILNTEGILTSCHKCGEKYIL